MKDCWFRILPTIVGMSVVDTQQWHRNLTSNININRIQEQCQDEVKYEMMVHNFSDIIRANLQDSSQNN